MTGRRRWFLTLIVSSAYVLSGCETSPSSSYPSVQAAARGGADAPTLAAGRKIFTTRCTECHVAPTVARFSIEQWPRLVGVMAPRARLKPGDRLALEAYLVAARKSLPGS